MVYRNLDVIQYLMQSATFSTRICFNGEIIVRAASVILWQPAVWMCLMYGHHLLISLKLKWIIWSFPVEIYKDVSYTSNIHKGPDPNTHWNQLRDSYLFQIIQMNLKKYINLIILWTIIPTFNADLDKFTFRKGLSSYTRKMWKVKKDNGRYLLAFFKQSHWKKKGEIKYSYTYAVT